MKNKSNFWIVASIVLLFVVLGLEINKRLDRQHLECPGYEIENISDSPWNSYDQQSLRLAQIKCGFVSSKNACLYKMIKTSINKYDITCGERQ